MTERECWQEVMREMQIEPLTLSPKISFTMRRSLTGMLFILARYKFGMNDESVNTGFYPFSCYIMALCCK